MVSAIFRNEKNLSLDRAPLVAEKLGLKGTESEYFCLLVELESARHSEHRERVIQKMSLLNPKKSAVDLSIDHFRVISDWYHFPILQMVGEKGFSQDPQQIGKRLGISKIEVEVALTRLERLEIIERDLNGNFRKINERIQFQSSQKSQALRKFHTEMLDRAVKSLTEQSPQQRQIQTQTLPIDPIDLPKIDELTDQFYERVVNLCKKGRNRTQMYHLATVFFNLTPEKR